MRVLIVTYIALYMDILYSSFFFFNDTATTEIYTLSLHDALPILHAFWDELLGPTEANFEPAYPDRKSTRLNSSHVKISYAVFCLKKKKLIITLYLINTKNQNLKNNKYYYIIS